MKARFFPPDIAFVLLLAVLLPACKKTSPPEIVPLNTGTILVEFDHRVSNAPLIYDSLLYETSLGNHYQVNDLQYFISDLRLHLKDGGWTTVLAAGGIHYVDGRVPSTMTWQGIEPLQAGTYDSIVFTFGLNADDNFSYRFSDPPERDMFWPVVLGGGYHYMKMNLKWRSGTMPELMPFMFHIGIGQMYGGTTMNPDSIIGYIQNYFTVGFPANLNLGVDEHRTIGIIMNIEKWFDSENAFDFSLYPMGIMQSQEGMYRACRNGKTAFSMSNDQ
jgi:hypothetical protein